MKKAMKYIALLLVFTLLAVGTTYVLIQRTLGEPLIRPKVDLPYEEIVPEAGIDLNGFYDQNHLVFTEITEELGEDREFTYPQISGLVNKDVEAAVNAAIAAEAEAVKQFFADKGTAINYMTYNVYANFSNVLSIGLFAGDEEYDFINRYLNINLNDGSLLRLEDLFGVQADLLGMVRSGFYESLTTFNFTDDYWETAQSPDENELYRVVTDYMAEEDKKFFFTPTEIYFCYGEDYTAHVDMEEHAEDITVYHKYLSEESLFERDDIGYKGIFNCVHIPEGHEVREFGFAAHNFWYDFGFGGLYLNDNAPQEAVDGLNAYVDARLAEMRGEIEAIGQEAAANPDTMYIFMAEPSFQPHFRTDYDGEGWGYSAFSKAVAYSGHTKLYTMPKALFDSKYRALMVEMYRENPYYILFEGIDHLIGDDVQHTRDDSEGLYRWDTGEEVTAATLFAEGYDDFAFIRAYAIDELVRYHGCSLEEARLLTEAIWYELEGGGLHIVIPAWGEERFLWLSLDQFAPSRLTIFE
ncbi:MAG: hypothetical protein IKK17_03145 [Oscillospiraceae bacterium]|nr:hypothetical protein [Oscillospiraceae bacterium]